MSDRPVAQIIGWEWREISWPVENRSSPGYDADPNVPYRRESHGYWAPPGQQVDDNGCEPNVDDILAWLTEHHTGDYVYGPDDTPGGHFVFAIWDDSIPQFSLDGEPRGWLVEVRHSPTLLEALEQAVRRIDEEE